MLLCLGLDFKRGGFVDRALEAFKEVLRLVARQPVRPALPREAATRSSTSGTRRIGSAGSWWSSSGPDTQPRSQAILAFLENELGIDALKAGDRDRGRASLRVAPSTLDSATTPAYLNLGDVRLQRGRHRRGGGRLEAADRVAPERAHLALERLRAALRQRGRAADVRGPVPPLHRCAAAGLARRAWRSACICRERGEPHAAFDLLLEALEQNPHGLTVHQAVWTVLLQLGLDRALVQRYIEARRGAVFFLDPHVCLQVPLPQHRAAVAVPALSRVEHVRRGADRRRAGRPRPRCERLRRAQLRREPERVQRRVRALRRRSPRTIRRCR